MSWINLGEVAYVLERTAGPEVAEAALREVRARAAVELPDEALVRAAARVKARNRMAYPDAFACATAAKHGAVLLTGDPGILGAKDAGARVEDLRGGPAR
jgi:predicted nucleic acid-binding protein